jgi:hypothetical protein
MFIGFDIVFHLTAPRLSALLLDLLRDVAIRRLLDYLTDDRVSLAVSPKELLVKNLLDEHRGPIATSLRPTVWVTALALLKLTHDLQNSCFLQTELRALLWLRPTVGGSMCAASFCPTSACEKSRV